jgi:predicted permease
MVEGIWNIATSPLVIGFVAGLIVGWNFLSQPAWVAKLIAKAKGNTAAS